MFYLYNFNSLNFIPFEDFIQIGRSMGNITFPTDDKLSGKHAQITIQSKDNNTTIWIEDLGSKNGTIVNRIEIPSQKKIEIQLLSYIEIGRQSFILTDSLSVSLQDLNIQAKTLEKKQITKLHENHPASLLETPVEANPYEEIKSKELLWSQLQNDIKDIELNTKQEIQRLNELKNQVISEAKEKISQLNTDAVAIKKEIELLKANLERVRSEMEQKKKKIINLKDFGSD